MSEKEPKKQPKYDKRKDPDTHGGDGLEEQVSQDPNFTRTKKSKEEEEEENKQNKKDKDEETKKDRNEEKDNDQ